MFKFKLNQIRGVTLIEVLIALVVLSIGLLGLAALQAESLKKNHQAYLTSLAGIEANDIINRMRANPIATTKGYYKTISATSAPHCDNNTSSDCNAYSVATTDLNEWGSSLSNSLPGGSGQICISSNPGLVGSQLNCDNQSDIYVIKISWQNRNGQTNEYRVSFKP